MEVNTLFHPCERCVDSSKICPVMTTFLSIEYGDLYPNGGSSDEFHSAVFSRIAGKLIMRMHESGFELVDINCSGRAIVVED